MFVSILKKMSILFLSLIPLKNSGANGDKGGNKNQSGPPDLEDMWRDFNKKLNSIFKGNNTSNSGGMSPESKSGAKIGVGLILIIISFLWMISGFFVVQEGQTGVVLTFGKYSYDSPSGFNWRWPYPIQSHEIVNISQVRTVEVGYQSNVKNKISKEALMLTDDENIIDIQFAVQYKLKSASDWIFKNREQESTVKQVAETSIREVVGRNKMDFVLYEGREKIAYDVSQLMQQILDRYNTGVHVTNVTMQGVQPPEQVQIAFDDAVKAGQDRERQKNEGQAYANDVIPKARGAAARLQEESQAYQSRIVANAEGNASRFKQILAEYQKAPVVTRDRMYYETMQQIFTNTTKMMIDSKNGSNLIYLPLDKLISQTLSNDSSLNSSKSSNNSTLQEVTNASDLLRAKENHLRDRESR